MSLKALFSLLKDTFEKWSNDKASRLGAAVAYYTIFSLAPLLIVVIGIAGLAFGQKAIQGEISGQIEGLVGHDAALMVQSMIANAGQRNSGIVATIIGIVTLLVGATGLFSGLQDALNTIWDAPKQSRGILGMLKDRLMTFAMVLVIAFLLLVSLVISAAIAALGQFLGNGLPLSETLLQVINFAISFGIITVLFALIYKVLPDVKVAWRDVWIGAAVTSLLFTIGKLLIGIYLGHSGTTSAYGAAGALIVILLWVYYSAQILFFGAEFTNLFARRYGSHREANSGSGLAKTKTASTPANESRQNARDLRPLVSSGRGQGDDLDWVAPTRRALVHIDASLTPLLLTILVGLGVVVFQSLRGLSRSSGGAGTNLG